LSRWAGSPRNRCASIKALVDHRDLIERVLQADEPINRLHIEVDRATALLALHQPMAVVLAIVSAVKINTDLERVGDLAISIAEAARYAQHSP
jgi:phosphate transport system protein